MVMERTPDGRPLRILAIIDEYIVECLARNVARRIRSNDVLDQLYELILRRGQPEYTRSDHGPEFAAKAVRKWLSRLDVTTLFIEPGSPGENGYIESFNGKMRYELLERRGPGHAGGGEGNCGGLAKGLQSAQAAQLAGIQAAGARGTVIGKFTLGLAQC